MTDTEAFAEFKAHIQANSVERELKLRAKIKTLEAELKAAKSVKTSVAVTANITDRNRLTFDLTRTLAPISQSHGTMYARCIELIQAFNGKVKND